MLFRSYINTLNGGQVNPVSGNKEKSEWVGSLNVAYDVCYWHPDGAPNGKELDRPIAKFGFPIIKGLVEKARSEFKSNGLKFPWFATYGNHDQLLQGTVAPDEDLNNLTIGNERIVGLPENGTAILGTYDLFTEKMAAGLNLKVIKFGEKNECDVRAADIEFREGRATFDLVTPLGRSAVSLQLLGLHQIPNALAAAAVGFAVGLSTESISAALSTAENKSKWRMELEELSETLLINDCYNANPESVIAALRTLALLTQERGGSSWAILGKMHELGESSASEHARVGKIAHDIEIDHLLAVGEPTYLSDIESGETLAVSLLSKDQVGEYIQHFQPGDVILVKASRAEKFETIVDEIRKVLKERSAL